MAVTPPNSAQVREIRDRAGKVASDRFDAVRTPLLAWLGAGDLALHKLGELPGELRTRLSADELRKRADTVGGQARRTYTELADRGADTLERIRRQPQVAKVLGEVRDASDQLDRRVERTVDNVHDASEEAMGRFSTETRSVGERAARAAERSAGRAADTAGRAGDEVAESVEAAGDETAHVTRSVSRKAANRAAAPRRPAATTRSTKGGTDR
jgi:heparin binding hemagglutinin HbhA